MVIPYALMSDVDMERSRDGLGLLKVIGCAKIAKKKWNLLFEEGRFEFKTG